MNLVVLKGRTGKDFDLRYSQSENPVAVAKSSLAVNRQKKGETDWINILAFGKTAELLADRVKKGTEIAIEGRLQCGSYQKDDGTKVYTTDVIVDRFHFCGSKQEGQAAGAPKVPPIQPGDVDGFLQLEEDDEDLPF